MRRIGISILTILLLALFPAVGARASSPHFITIGADPTIGSPNLNVTFMEAGLGSIGTINYRVTSDATAICECADGSSGPATDPMISATTSFGKNGEVTVSASNPITIPPPSANFSCYGEQPPTLASVTYTNVMVTDCTDRMASPTLPGPFVFTNPNASPG
jgi:hypothetical protein